MTGAFLDDGFDDRLRCVLLEGYAHDVPLVGTWVLCDRDGNVPTFEVLVRLDRLPLDAFAEGENEAHRTRLFEQALRDLVLTAFAEGVDVEGTWTATFPSVAVPDWWVEITVDSAIAETDGRTPGPGRQHSP